MIVLLDRLFTNRRIRIPIKRNRHSCLKTQTKGADRVIFWRGGGGGEIVKTIVVRSNKITIIFVQLEIPMVLN